MVTTITNPNINMKSAVLVSLIASAAAFAPAQQAITKTSLSAFEDELGAQPPLGFFDPLGLVEDGDQEKFDRLGETEIKHGRISMLAFLGQKKSSRSDSNDSSNSESSDSSDSDNETDSTSESSDSDSDSDSNSGSESSDSNSESSSSS